MQCCMDHLPWDIISLPLPTYFFHAMPNFLARVKTKLSKVHCLVALMTAPCTGRQPPWTHTSGLICRGTVVTLWWPRLPHVTPVIRVWVLTALVNFFLLNYITTGLVHSFLSCRLNYPIVEEVDGWLNTLEGTFTEFWRKATQCHQEKPSVWISFLLVSFCSFL